MARHNRSDPELVSKAVTLVTELAGGPGADVVSTAAYSFGVSEADLWLELLVTDPDLTATLVGVPVEVQHKLLELSQKDLRIGRALVQNPSCTPKVIEALACTSGRSPTWLVPAALSHPNCPTELLTRAAQTPLHDAALYAVSNPNCPAPLLGVVASAELGTSVRSLSRPALRAVMSNPNCPAELKERIVGATTPPSPPPPPPPVANLLTPDRRGWS